MAAWLPPVPQTADDPALYLLIDGHRLAPVSVAQGRRVYVLPNAGATVRLVSRSAVPAETRPWVADDRRLGVMLSNVTVRSSASVLPIPLDHPALAESWWQPERHGPTMLRRWTNGDALLKLADAHLIQPGACLLEIEIAATLSYPLPAAHSGNRHAPTEVAARSDFRRATSQKPSHRAFQLIVFPYRGVVRVSRSPVRPLPGKSCTGRISGWL